jgi:integrase
MVKSTRSSKSRKSDNPAKPYPDFPLFPHATRRWAKKIRGKMCYFGPWDKPQDALERYIEERDFLFAGRKPEAAKGGLTIADLANKYLTAKRHKVDAGEMSLRGFGDCYRTCQLIVEEFGKTALAEGLGADDFQRLRAGLAKRLGPVRLGNEIARVRSVFRWGELNDHIEKRVKFGSEFIRPSKKILRLNRAANGQRMLDPADLRRLIDVAPRALKAMTLLALNCGFGNSDCSSLPLSALDLDRGWIDFPRPKTGLDRRAPLWRETIAAIRAYLERRPRPKTSAEADLVFLTTRGQAWVTVNIIEEVGLTRVVNGDALGREFAKLLAKFGLRKKGIGFYALRHIFRTVADNTNDQKAIDRLMGHADGTMGGEYIERLEDCRLQAVTDHVRGWLFPVEQNR